MTAKRVMLAAMAATALGIVAGAVPANAQYGGGRYYNNDGDDYRPRRYERRYEDEDDRPRPRRFGRGGGGGSICVTARGNCQYPPAPRNASCSCDIPGFGEKRGAIGGGY